MDCLQFEQIGAIDTKKCTKPVTSSSKVGRIVAMVPLPLFALGIVNPVIAAAAVVDDDDVATSGLVARCLSEYL